MSYAKCSMCDHYQRKIEDNNIFRVKHVIYYCNIPKDFSTEEAPHEGTIMLHYQIIGIDNNEFREFKCPLLRESE